MMKKRNPHLEDLSPWYANQSLNQFDEQRFEAWLETHPEAKDDLVFWQDMRRSILDQSLQLPAAQVFKDIQARIGNSAHSVVRSQRILSASLTGIIVAMLVFSLLWLTVKPGTTLRWSMHGVEPTSFHIYRAPTGSELYKLVGVVTVRENQMVYQYRDFLLFPGRIYQYRVEGISNYGEIAFSQAVISDPLPLLPGQLSILITSIVMGYVCLVASQSRFGKLPARTSQSMA